jgi:SNF2 family DNA or RNA helicase
MAKTIVVEDGDQPPAKRTTRQSTHVKRSIVTPSPKSICDNDDNEPEISVVEENEDNQSKVEPNRMTKNTRKSNVIAFNGDDKSSRSKRTKLDPVEPVILLSSSDVNVVIMDNSKEICKPCAPVGRDETINSAMDDLRGNTGGENDSNNEDSDQNDDFDEDRPFTVEYATSSRSTCRRCDSVISKGSLRVSHVPLFRGKPGYRVYRHLACAVFSEDIVVPQDVAGWKKLKKDDFKLLCERVEESKLEIKRENDELDPDELIQKGFQGEIRSSPPGFVGTQLPFQVEGQSWMYHQEVHTPEIRGGILADEMGMVRLLLLLIVINLSL